MPASLRVKLFTEAIRKAKELFGDKWGIAYNGVKVRTQCHFHVHVGQFIPASETSLFRMINTVGEIPALAEDGLWIHPVKGGMHLHAGEQTAETVLLR
jgi:hypothetical protein